MAKATKDPQPYNSPSENPIDKTYWNSKWIDHQIGWDVGGATPAITAYMAQYANKNAAILIPGCGNAYEAEYLVANGFNHITLIDIAPRAVSILTEKFAHKPQVTVLCEDFFEHQGDYDLIIEQTFFCAIPPNKRDEYAEKTASLLNKNGKIIGLMFDRVFEAAGPPFGGYMSDYKQIFDPFFIIKSLDKCNNSILPRANSEVFINLIKK